MEPGWSPQPILWSLQVHSVESVKSTRKNLYTYYYIYMKKKKKKFAPSLSRTQSLDVKHTSYRRYSAEPHWHKHLRYANQYDTTFPEFQHQSRTATSTTTTTIANRHHHHHPQPPP